MKRGLTLVELLIVMAILAILMVMAIGIFNPKLQQNKANDARRKTDIGRIKVAFEEYFNDKGCYPTEAVITGLTCSSSGFSQWGINSWPCDPMTKIPYYIYIEKPTGCSSWYKILTNLSNKKDPQIPVGWYDIPNPGYGLSGSLTVNDVNFGVSSPNVLWYDLKLDPVCFEAVKGCYLPQPDGSFGAVNDQEVCNAYLAPNYGCLVKCCLNGALCPDSSSCP